MCRREATCNLLMCLLDVVLQSRRSSPAHSMEGHAAGWGGGGATPSSAASEAPSSLFGRGSVHGSAGHLGPVPEGTAFLVCCCVSSRNGVIRSTQGVAFTA